MKYKVGDKVKYDSGDWLFYGTVTAVIENSINPCYRLSVDRMVKKNCRFSITQFEFELEADKEDECEQDSLKWEKIKIEYFKKYFVTPTKEEISDVITQEPVFVPKPIPESILIPVSAPVLESAPVSIPVSAPVLESVPEPKQPEPEVKQKRKYRQKQKPEPASIPEPAPAPMPEPIKVETPRIGKEAKEKRKRGEAWESNFEAYRAGDRSKKTHAWISINRKLYKTGDLSEDRFERLMEINFPFEIQKIKRGPKAGWGKQLELWKKGERNTLQEWRQRSVRQYVAGKLSKDKIEKLKEVGILK